MELIIGTRGSKLALIQANLVSRALQDAAHIRGIVLTIAIQRIVTTGDRIQDRPLADIGGKALFVEEIEAALRERRIHLAVHSAKDMPSEMPNEFCLAACAPREDVRDVFISNTARSLADLPHGARIGTSSPRRAAQLRAIRKDVTVREIRGNVDTRLGKLECGDYDAIVLAAAGVHRLGLAERITQYLETDVMLPAASQAAIAMEARTEDSETIALLEQVNHVPTHTAIRAERAFAAAVGGDCHTPIAAYARIADTTLTLEACLANADGRTLRATLSGPTSQAETTGAALALELLACGGRELLADHAAQRAFTAGTQLPRGPLHSNS